MIANKKDICHMYEYQSLLIHQDQQCLSNNVFIYLKKLLSITRYID